jgi:hypothetical protein
MRGVAKMRAAESDLDAAEDLDPSVGTAFERYRVKP